ncbi:MAG: aldo/keto reductase [Thermodesulfobacteriota bacterium]
MEYISIGKDPISISRVGFGTGSSGYSGEIRQAGLAPGELSGLLVYSYDRGINFWDTAASYGTYPHIREALKVVPRRKVVISSKFSDSLEKTTARRIYETLKSLQTDYLDICLLHGPRNAFEIMMRSGALEALLKAKEKGYIRMVGLSAHGIGAIERAMVMEEIDLLFVRLNWTGASMDAYQEGPLSKLIAVPYVKEIARSVVPRRLVPSFSGRVESLKSNADEREVVKDRLSGCPGRNKAVVAMKVFGAGSLTDRIERSLQYIMSLRYVDAFLLGMTSRAEIDENLEIYDKIIGKKHALSQMSM